MLIFNTINGHKKAKAISLGIAFYTTLSTANVGKNTSIMETGIADFALPFILKFKIMGIFLIYPQVGEKLKSTNKGKIFRQMTEKYFAK
ncbi:MAG: hypothetical protein LUF82_04585 [Clostridia bacterium]|nr:hypothetical protein [Clostridia bacterium]